MKTCWQVEELMSPYLDGELEPEEEKEIEEHLNECDRCSQQLQPYKELLGVFCSAEEDEPQNLRQRILASVYNAAECMKHEHVLALAADTSVSDDCALALAHAEDCASCAAELEQYRELLTVMPRSEEFAPEGLRQAILTQTVGSRVEPVGIMHRLRSLLVPAGTAIAVAGAVLVVAVMKQNPVKEAPQIVHQPLIPSVVQQESNSPVKPVVPPTKAVIKKTNVIVASHPVRYERLPSKRNAHKLNGFLKVVNKPDAKVAALPLPSREPEFPIPVEMPKIEVPSDKAEVKIADELIVSPVKESRRQLIIARADPIVPATVYIRTEQEDLERARLEELRKRIHTDIALDPKISVGVTLRMVEAKF